MLTTGTIYKPEGAVAAEQRGEWHAARYAARSHQSGGDVALSFVLRGRPIIDRVGMHAEHAAKAPEFQASPEYSAYRAALDRLADNRNRLAAAREASEEAQSRFRSSTGTAKDEKSWHDSEQAVNRLRESGKVLRTEMLAAREVAEAAWRAMLDVGRVEIHAAAQQQRDDAVAELLRVAAPFLDRVVIAETKLRDLGTQTLLTFAQAGLSLDAAVPADESDAESPVPLVAMGIQRIAAGWDRSLPEPGRDAEPESDADRREAERIRMEREVRQRTEDERRAAGGPPSFHSPEFQSRHRISLLQGSQAARGGMPQRLMPVE